MTAAKKIKDHGFDNVVVFKSPSYDSALIGVTTDNRAVYDYDKMVSYLVKKDKMTEEEAAEFIDFNTVGSLNGSNPKLPIVVHVF